MPEEKSWSDKAIERAGRYMSRATGFGWYEIIDKTTGERATDKKFRLEDVNRVIDQLDAGKSINEIGT